MSVLLLRCFDGCPNWRLADERLPRALAQIGASSEIVYEAVETPEEGAPGVDQLVEVLSR